MSEPELSEPELSEPGLVEPTGTSGLPAVDGRAHPAVDGHADGVPLARSVLLDAGGDPVEALREHVGRTVLAHPGVLRLEPTLLGAVRGLGQRSSLDGIQLAARGRLVDLDLNVATRADHQARECAVELHRLLVDLVGDHGFVPGTIEISVLAIEEPTP